MKIMYTFALGLLCSPCISWNMEESKQFMEYNKEQGKLIPVEKNTSWDAKSQQYMEYNREAGTFKPVQNEWIGKEKIGVMKQTTMVPGKNGWEIKERYVPTKETTFVPVEKKEDKATNWYPLEPKPITAQSFNYWGKSLLKKYVEHMQAASKECGCTHGLAAICNAIPATDEGIQALIQDSKALSFANEYNKTLVCTQYPNLSPLFSEIKNARYKGCENLSFDVQHALASILLYPTIKETSDIRMPLENMGMMFMGTDIDTNVKVLQQNNTIDSEKNAPYAKAAALLMAYCTQQCMNQ